MKKILIANRGEIAVRIIRACREMGIETVAVYSEADKDALHTKLADEAICIGPAASADSYLSMERIISATVVSGADAIHPGFGFLSENSKFAELCEQCHITFIGPDSATIARLGNKQEARNTMIEAGVPVIPGSQEAVYTAEEGKKLAEEIGYPIMIKAALGGGGKGMREVYTPEEFETAFQTAQKEAENAFHDNTMYLEHLVLHPRHIEFLLEKDGSFYFMEMNTRIQVEHPVTECVTGIDLIKAQIRIASGEKLMFTQEDIHITGHAIECRINAENPGKNFRPSPGTISDMYLPGGKGVRIDTAIYSGYTIPPYYDSMIAKLIVWAHSRKEAIDKLRSALGEVIIEGVDTNVDYQYGIVNHPDFVNGTTDTDFIRRIS